MTAMRLKRYPSSGGVALGKMGVGATMMKPLPYDAEVEYLESTGTQWIDTGIAVNTDTDVIDCLVEVTAVVPYGTVFGVYEVIAGAGRFFGIRRNAKQDTWQTLWGSLSHTLYLNTPYNIRYKYGTNTCYINETTGSSNMVVNYTNTLYVFAMNSDGNVNLTNKMRLYRFSITRNGAKILDLIPVRVGTTGYIYDRVSGKLFGNAGTGAFLYGNDI